MPTPGLILQFLNSWIKCEILILSCICFIWDSWFKLLRSNIWKVFCICLILCSFSLISKLWLAIFILARFNFPSSSASLKSFWFPSDINWTKVYLLKHSKTVFLSQNFSSKIWKTPLDYEIKLPSSLGFPSFLIPITMIPSLSSILRRIIWGSFWLKNFKNVRNVLLLLSDILISIFDNNFKFRFKHWLRNIFESSLFFDLFFLFLFLPILLADLCLPLTNEKTSQKKIKNETRPDSRIFQNRGLFLFFGLSDIYFFTFAKCFCSEFIAWNLKCGRRFCKENSSFLKHQSKSSKAWCSREFLRFSISLFSNKVLDKLYCSRYRQIGQTCLEIHKFEYFDSIRYRCEF